MKEKFYTNCVTFGNQLLYRGVESGLRTKRKVNYKPKMFVPKNTKEETKFKTLSGVPVSPLEFDSISEAKDFLRQYEDVENFTIYGNTWFHYVYLAEEFPDTVNYDPERIVVANIDIETTYDQGFPNEADPVEEIIAITFKVKDFYYVFGCKDYQTDNPKIKYFKCKDEAQLLLHFINKWDEISPDVITGWNVQFFDIPYLVNRISRVLGESEAKKLSPWRLFTKRNSIIKGQAREAVELVGSPILDYYELYTKFRVPVIGNQENYKLNTIAYVELGETKLAYDEHDGLAELYKEDFQKFIDYNIKDVDLVDKLEQKLRLLEQALHLAYDAHVNYTDVFSQVRMWDTIIFGNLKKENIVIPQKKHNSKNEQYAGAFVKDPIVGLHNWVVSLDINALYPSLILQFNISPEMLRAGEFRQVSVEDLLDKKVDLKSLKDAHITMTANGHNFDIERQGFLPRIIDRMYTSRKEAKKKMIEAQKEMERVNEELKRRNNV